MQFASFIWRLPNSFPSEIPLCFTQNCRLVCCPHLERDATLILSLNPFKFFLRYQHCMTISYHGCWNVFKPPIIIIIKKIYGFWQHLSHFLIDYPFCPFVDYVFTQFILEESLTDVLHWLSYWELFVSCVTAVALCCTFTSIQSSTCSRLCK